jgi:hypothetical protein
MTENLQAWTTRKLRYGDLTALSNIAHGSWPEDERVRRLSRRGFVVCRRSGRLAVTGRGRIALMIRRLSR